MGNLSRSKGQRVERAMLHLHHDAGVPCCKVSRTGYTGHALQVADTFTAEVKSRANGEGFSTLARWLGSSDLLFLRRDRQHPLVVMSWSTYITIVTGKIHDV
jgi:hypothetical protein